MKQILKILVLNLCSIGFFATIASAQFMSGPPMLCGKQNAILGHPTTFKETPFMVLPEERKKQGPYFILYRNEKTSTWTFIAYNIPNAPPGIICMLHGGMASYILPSLDEIKKTLDKQKEGFDKPSKSEYTDKTT